MLRTGNAMLDIGQWGFKEMGGKRVLNGCLTWCLSPSSFRCR